MSSWAELFSVFVQRRGSAVKTENVQTFHSAWLWLVSTVECKLLHSAETKTRTQTTMRVAFHMHSLCLCGCMGSRSEYTLHGTLVLRFSSFLPSSNKYTWIGDSIYLLDANVCLCTVPYDGPASVPGVYPDLTLNVPGIDSEFTTTLTRIKRLRIMNEWTEELVEL